jgi:hypothetical protein
MGYKKLFILLNSTATFNTLNHTSIYTISHGAPMDVYHDLHSQGVSMKGSPPKKANVAPPDRVANWAHSSAMMTIHARQILIQDLPLA